MMQHEVMPSAHAEDRPARITTSHLRKLAIVYVRQSSPGQVRDHIGSAAAQRELAEVPRRWGWPEDQIKIIDADQGVTAGSPSKRSGFQQMLDLVSGGLVGLVVVRNVDRLTRNNFDGPTFFDALTRTSTLVEADGRLYDPTNEDDETFVLHLLGLLAWRENRQRVRMMSAARAAKARQGYAVSAPPTGYVASAHGQWEKDPDQEVQAAVARVFELYPRLGSLGRIVKYLRQHGLLFPRRRNGQIAWKPIDVTHLYSVLTNPVYTGDYVYGRYESIRKRHDGDQRPRVRPRSDWVAVKEQHHPPYVSHANWQRIQDLLSSRRPTTRPISGKGHALLQGLLRCECGKWLQTRYWGHEGQARTASYRCHRKDGWGGVKHKVVLPARLVDQSVVRQVLAHIKPLEVASAEAAIREALADDLDLHRAQRRQVQEVQGRINQLRDAYLQADSRNRRVKLDLEEQLEEALGHKRELVARFANSPSPQPSLSEADADELAKLTQNIEALWNAATTMNDDRKALLRTVLTEIAVRRVTAEAVELELVWTGGLRQPITVLRAKGVQAVAREQHTVGRTIEEIVEDLQATGATTAFGRSISRDLVAAKLRHAGIKSTEARRAALALIREKVLENERPSDIRARLNQQFSHLGPWTPQRFADAVCQLRRGTLGIEPFPEILPADAEKEEALAIIDQNIAAGETWTTTAARLNDAGLRPPRGREFTPVQARLLYLRSKGLTSFRLPSRRSVARD